MLIGWVPGGTAVPEIPTGFALGMTDLGVVHITGLLIQVDKHFKL